MKFESILEEVIHFIVIDQRGSKIRLFISSVLNGHRNQDIRWDLALQRATGSPVWECRDSNSLQESNMAERLPC